MSHIAPDHPRPRRPAVTWGLRQKRRSTRSFTGHGSNELLSYVPADTPYLFANLEPVPEEVIDTYLAAPAAGARLHAIAVEYWPD